MSGSPSVKQEGRDGGTGRLKWVRAGWGGFRTLTHSAEGCAYSTMTSTYINK